jgi:hypothetical protein
MFGLGDAAVTSRAGHAATTSTADAAAGATAS